MQKAKVFIRKCLSPNLQERLRLNYYFLRSVFYKGNKVYCPICHSSHRTFLDYSKSVTNYICPRCGSHPRHRLLWLYLKRETNIYDLKPKTILHFAPEHFFKKRLSALENVTYIDADLNSPLATHCIDITNIPFDNDNFDVILCSHVLEHVDDDKRAMAELLRVLKPGGWAILQVPIDVTRRKTFEDPSITSPEDRAKYYGEADHKRFYGLDYPDRLEEAGFSVSVEPFLRNYFHTKDVTRLGLDRDEEIHLCRKM